ncbi:MAG: hypothetical protein ACJ74R_05035 [Gaiellaceae bacterium]
MALLLGILALVVLPASVEVARREPGVDLLEAAYGIPLAFVLALVALVMARRARQNLRWLQLRETRTGVASTAVIVAAVALCLTITAALSIGFYELFLLYQHSR